MSDGGPPPGWVAICGTLTPSGVVGAYAARAQSVRGSCRAKGCRRSLDLDPVELCADGLGAISMERIKRLWRCHRVPVCEITFHDAPPGKPLRLVDLTRRPHARVRVRCRKAECAYSRVWTAEALIKGLADRRQGDERAPVDGLAGKMTSVCPHCKAADWAVDVVWADTSTMGWRTLGEKYFERYRSG